MQQENNSPEEKKLIIQLNSQQIDQVNRWLKEISRTHIMEECEPPGFEIAVSFAGPWGQFAEAKCGSDVLDLGDVVCHPSPKGWGL